MLDFRRDVDSGDMVSNDVTDGDRDVVSAKLKRFTNEPLGLLQQRLASALQDMLGKHTTKHESHQSFMRGI